MSFLFYFLSRIPIFVHFLFKFAPMGQSPRKEADGMFYFDAKN